MTSPASDTAHQTYTIHQPGKGESAQSWISIIVMMLSATACGPGISTDAGDSIGETTGDTGGELVEPLTPGTELRCVERDAGVVTCWVGWGAAKALTMLPCQAQAIVELGVWTPAFDHVLDYWGPVSCHSLVGNDEPDVCLYSGSRVHLEQQLDGGWAPEVSPTVCGLPEVDAPCGDVLPGPVECGAGVCDDGYGCTIADTCVDCAFVAGVYGCGCNISGECESTSICVAGVCSAY